MNPTIEVNRKSSLADDPVHLRIFGLEPAETYLLKTAMRDDFGRVWEALAEFTADGDGCIDLQSAVPERGTYEGQDAMGLFWSMRLNDLSDKMPYFMKINTETQTVTVIVDKNGDRLAERQFDLTFRSDDVQETFVTDGFVGKYFAPDRASDLPALLVVGGSGGGFQWSEQVAALLASRGYAALAVAYFDYRGQYDLPTGLAEIRIEQFRQAAEWLKARKETDGRPIRVMGISKGAELALLLGSVFPDDICTVVAYAPSLYVFQGIQIGVKEAVSSWSYDGKPFEYVSYPPDYEAREDFDKTTLRDMYIHALRDKEAVQNARIPVERMKCGLMLVTGDLDALGPTSEMSVETLQILEQQNYPYLTSHLRYPKADHSFFIPGLPPIVLSKQAEACDIAKAERDAWWKVISFMQT
ncbi:acyl-CoA thioesterase/BAAT N-terminal domain-containing protein [Paenibacillus sp. N3/727]|uniref:acyl-CoA thioesterase/bile acid-CoA:amino acid N-acyltransferase family protein n=1 Tax=Paenibacillus sp. N3/727 TaxID=2925845 RepID=UPI001F53CBDD|nr:acyl-CoA thioesterase/bile acid-CoA:amino acid N-acyltransferase family protein [Paenibacillus sp. N3/727]UNK16909.1 acyl-CoA thioesterase/BAAT N-terminal domain-containing protein [Paenibacillus sp. N3/727]